MVLFGDIDARKHFRSLALQFGVDFEPYHHELTDAASMYSFGGRPVVTSQNLF